MWSQNILLGEHMARKYEFKPDKPHSGFWDKLYITPQQRKLLLKWGLYTVLLLVLSVLQDVIFCKLDIFGATTDLVPCCIFLVCVLEGVEAGSIFSLTAAVVYFFSGTAAGPYCIPLIVVLAVMAAIFRQSYLQRGFGAVMLCTAVITLLYELLVFGAGLFLELTYGGRFGVFFLTGILSWIAVPVLYPVCKLIGNIGGEIWKE